MTVHYVPAGCEAYSGAHYDLYVKDVHSDKEYSEFGRREKHWVTHTKDVRLVVSGHKAVLPTSKYDYLVSTCSPDFMNALGVKIILANPLLKPYSKKAFRSAGVYTILDSGGFQMLHNKCTFVSPDDVIARYNKDADIGMPLDIPCRAIYEQAYFDRISHIMKCNDDYIAQRLNPNVKMSVISHGTTIKRRESRLDVLDRDDAEVVAIAGLNINPKDENPIFAKCEQLMYVLSRIRGAKYYHVLGVTDKFFLFVYCLLDCLKYVKNIGADSVSHRLIAITGGYIQSNFKVHELQHKLNVRESLMCTCPICTALNDSRIIQEPKLLECHNLWSITRYVDYVHSLVELYLSGTISLQKAYDLSSQKVDFNVFKLAIEYVQNVTVKGFYSFPITRSKSGGLFKQKHHKVTSEHYEQIIKNYSKFYGKKF